MSDITRANVAVADGLRRLVRTIAVARHHVWAAGSHLPALVRTQHARARLEIHDLNVVAWDGLADGAWPDAGEFGCAADRRNLRHAVSFVNLEPGSPAPPVHQLNWHRCSAGCADTQRGQVGPGQVGR